MTRLLAALALGGPLLLVVVDVVAGATRPGYSFLAQPVSDLGLGPRAWLLNSALIVCGLAAVALAVALQRIAPHRVGTTLLALFGACLALAGVFPEPSPGAPVQVGGILHFVLGFFVGLTALGGGLLVAGRRLRGWRGLGRASTACGIAVLVLIPVTFVFFSPTSPLFAIGIGGLVERVLFLVFCGWMVATAARVLREVGDRAREAETRHILAMIHRWRAERPDPPDPPTAPPDRRHRSTGPSA
jgi:hypothetical membrane protein